MMEDPILVVIAVVGGIGALSSIVMLLLLGSDYFNDVNGDL